MAHLLHLQGKGIAISSRKLRIFKRAQNRNLVYPINRPVTLRNRVAMVGLGEQGGFGKTCPGCCAMDHYGLPVLPNADQMHISIQRREQPAGRISIAKQCFPLPYGEQANGAFG